MLDKARDERIVVDYKDIHKQAVEDNFKSATELPYFEGDFWPNVIEESIKEIEMEQQKVIKQEQETAKLNAELNNADGLSNNSNIEEEFPGSFRVFSGWILGSTFWPRSGLVLGVSQVLIGLFSRPKQS